jgi:hypothetical protein
MRLTRQVALTALTLISTQTAAATTLDKIEVDTGPAKFQVVLEGLLLGGTVADLAVVDVDENGDRSLTIYAHQDGKWVAALEAGLRPDISFVDVANINGRERLLTWGAGQLEWFDPESSSERPLMPLESDFVSPINDYILHVDISRDINGDHREDLVVPLAHSFHVMVQLPDGSFADPLEIGPSTGQERLYDADGYRYDPWATGRVHELDYNLDGRTDLAYWNGDQFQVHLQEPDGLFAIQAQGFTTDVEFDSDDMAALAAPHGIRNRKMDHNPEGNRTGSVLHSLADQNGDGVADLAVFSLHGESLWKMRSTYEVHFGAPSPDGGTEFSADNSTAIDLDGLPFMVEQQDFDNDGQVDMMFTVINPNIFKVVGMLTSSLFTNSAPMDLKLFRLDAGNYPDKATTTRKVYSHSFGESGEKASHFPAVRTGDVTGDDRMDLVVGKRKKELLIYPGQAGPKLFERRPVKLSLAVPEQEGSTWLADLDRDGRQDIVMHHTSNEEPHRVTILLSRTRQ